MKLSTLAGIFLGAGITGVGITHFGGWSALIIISLGMLVVDFGNSKNWNV